MITTIILTKNEQIHLERAIQSASLISSNIYVIDSYSTDDTKLIATKAGAKFLQNKFINHAQQFNWGLSQIGNNIDWILRLDADEYITRELANNIISKLPNLCKTVTGIELQREIKFMGEDIKWGGVNPTKSLRLFRNGYGRCEQRWMDEHIIVNGNIASINGLLIDDNLRSLTWWINKHNNYSNLEAIEILNKKYDFLGQDVDFLKKRSKTSSVKNFIKNYVYLRMPPSIRSSLYFAYRYFFRLGFLDGKTGLTYHFLQGLWYRYLVDAKVQEIENCVKKHNIAPKIAIEKYTGIKL